MSNIVNKIMLEAYGAAGLSPRGQESVDKIPVGEKSKKVISYIKQNEGCNIKDINQNCFDSDLPIKYRVKIINYLVDNGYISCDKSIKPYKFYSANDNNALNEDDTTLSTRQLGSKKALETKGFDDWTREQYAAAFLLMKFGRSALNGTKLQGMKAYELAEELGIKESTLQQAILRLKFIYTSGAEGIESGGPKQTGYVNEFREMSKDQLLNLTLKAVTDAANKKQAQPDMKGKKSIKDLSPEELAKINGIRMQKGLEPIRVN